jgi:hypothetical protein
MNQKVIRASKFAKNLSVLSFNSLFGGKTVFVSDKAKTPTVTWVGFRQETKQP